jgi:hypothetical protein
MLAAAVLAGSQSEISSRAETPATSSSAGNWPRRFRSSHRTGYEHLLLKEIEIHFSRDRRESEAQIPGRLDRSATLV